MRYWLEEVILDMVASFIPLRNRHQDEFRSTSDLLGIMPVRENVECIRGGSETLDSDDNASLTSMKKREKENKL